jgi:hypothetical protein
MGLELVKLVDIISDIIFASFCVLAGVWIIRNWS